jgi:hypothetical protein
VGKGASADVFSLIVWGGEALIRVQRALLRGIDMLPGEDQPPKGERLTGRLYFERQPPEMREAIGLPMSGGNGEWPPEDDEAEAARLTAEGAAWERFLERKRRRQNHHTYGAPETIAAAEAARSGKATTKARGTRQAAQHRRA